MEKTTNVGSRLHNPAVGGALTGANEIKDDTKGKMQNVINQETDAELLRLDEAKQNNLTFDQTPTENSTNPVTSGGVYAADAALQQAIEAILLLIPSAASALNQLADKSFVNSSIATATATFRGTYNLVTDLELTVSATHQQIATALASVISTADNNDYCFVQIPVSDQSTDIRVTERYKFDGTSWEYEYDLNNSGFTADQWGAINSGITSVLVGKLGGLPTAAELATMFAGKQNTLTFDNTPVAGSDNPVKSSGLYNAFAAINALIPTGADANNKLVAENRLVSYVTTLINALDATFNVTSGDGHVTLRMTQTNGVITSVQILTSDIASDAALTTLGGRVSTAEADIDALQEAYAALTQSDVVIVEGALPSSGQQQNIIYRQPDQDHTPPQFYSDYMWNGTTWVLMATYMNAIDPRPKKGSQNLVTSGGVFDNMGALDVSELNATENPHTLATYADLSAALAAIPSDYQKGGMSIKFVQTSDNKYVQYRLMADDWSTVVSDWQGVDDEPMLGSRNLIESGGVYESVYVSQKLFVKVYNQGTESAIEKRIPSVVNGVLLIGDWNNENYAVRNLSLQDNGDITLIIRKVDTNGDEVATDGYYYVLPASSFTENTKGITYLRYPNSNNRSVLIAVDISQLRSDGNINMYAKKYHLALNQACIVKLDSAPTNNSNDYLTSGAVYTALMQYSKTSEILALRKSDVLRDYFINGWILVDGTPHPSSYVENFYFSQKLRPQAGLTIEKVHTVQVGEDGKCPYCWFYDENDNLLGTLTSDTRYDNISFTLSAADIPANTMYLRVQISTATFESMSNVDYLGAIRDELENIKSKISSQYEDIAIMNIPTIYGRKTPLSVSYNRFNNKVYPEGCIFKDEVINVNGGREGIVNNVGDEGSFNKPVVFANMGGVKKQVSISRKNTDVTAISGKAFVLCIGESTTAMDTPNPYNPESYVPFGWPSALQLFSDMDNADGILATIKTLGTRGYWRNQSAYTYTYKQVQKVLRSYNEGRSGWASYTIMNFPCWARVDSNSTSVLGGESMWYALGLATKTPYNQSGFNPDVEAYTGSNEQIALMTDTPFGKYKVDGSSILWGWIQAKQGTTDGNGYIFPVFSDTDAYIGSASQIAEMQDWFDAICANPDNRFYSIEEARTGQSGTAFSLEKYLERYRTMDDNGNRLYFDANRSTIGTAGSGNIGYLEDGTPTELYIGTQISNTMLYDVCEPTHIILNVGINDCAEPNPVSNAVACIKRVVGLFSQPTAYFICRTPGVLNTGAWADVAVCRKFDYNNRIATVLNELCNWFNSQNGRYLLPAYQIQYPCSVTGNFVFTDMVDGKEKVNCSIDNIHLGNFGSRSVGWQCLMWMNYLMQ